MSLIQFPQKGSLIVEQNPLGVELHIPKGVKRPDIIAAYRDFDFRGAYANFPEIGEGFRRNREFAISERFPISCLVSAALFAADVKKDTEAHNELLKIYKYLKQAGYREVPAKILPVYLIGYVINLTEERSVRAGSPLPEAHYLHSSYFGAFLVSGWNNLADTERESAKLKNN